MEPVRINNRRGQRSRTELLDVASRLMAERGYAATSLATVAAECGLPKSAVLYHFASKAALLSEVMARGAYDFFESMRRAHAGGPPTDSPSERLHWYLQRTGEVFSTRSAFLRLHFLLLMSTEIADEEDATTADGSGSSIRALIMQVRRDGRAYMNEMIASSFTPAAGPEAAQVIADRLDYFAIAGFDGAFVAHQAEADKTMSELIDQLADALSALGSAMLPPNR